MPNNRRKSQLPSACALLKYQARRIPQSRGSTKSRHLYDAKTFNRPSARNVAYFHTKNVPKWIALKPHTHRYIHTIQYNTIQDNTTQHNTTQYLSIQYNTNTYKYIQYKQYIYYIQYIEYIQYIQIHTSTYIYKYIQVHTIHTKT